VKSAISEKKMVSFLRLAEISAACWPVKIEL